MDPKTFSHVFWPSLGATVGGAMGGILYCAGMVALKVIQDTIVSPKPWTPASSTAPWVLALPVIGFPLAVVCGSLTARKLVSRWFAPKRE